MHDPLCPMNARTEGTFTIPCVWCETILAVRADERERIADIVGKIEGWYDESESFTTSDGRKIVRVWIDSDETVALIRGDAEELEALRAERGGQ